jgi:hypothetical protein
MVDRPLSIFLIFSPKHIKPMTFSKTFFAIALLLCFLSVKTNAQVGLTMNHVKKSVVYKPQNNPFKLKPHALNLPKVSYLENPYYTREGENNASFGGNSLEAVFSGKSSVVERVVGGLLFFAR